MLARCTTIRAGRERASRSGLPAQGVELLVTQEKPVLRIGPYPAKADLRLEDQRRPGIREAHLADAPEVPLFVLHDAVLPTLPVAAPVVFGGIGSHRHETSPPG